MKKISKAKVIKDAFLEELPVGEPWYEERLEECNKCEYNSKNKTDLNLKQKAQHLLGNFCTACTCFIDRKAGRRVEECGLVEIGLEPKWSALMIETADKEDFNIYNNTPDVVNLSFESDAFILDYGKIKKDSDTSVSILMEGEKNIVSVVAGCGCTTPQHTKLSDKLTEIKVSINLENINGVFSKSLTIKCDTGEVYIVRLKGEVLNG